MLTEPPPPTLARIIRSLFFVSFAADPAPIVFVGWSLEYEMLFYLAVSLGLTVRRPFWDALAVLFAMLAIVGVFSAPSQAVARFLTSPMMLEFVLGIIVARTLVDGRAPWLSMGAVTAALLAILAIQPTTRALTIGLPAFCLIALAAWADTRRRVAGGPLFCLCVLLGDASYSIYLGQVLLMSALIKAIASMSPHFPLELLTVAGTLMIVAGGLAGHLLVERPLTRFLHRWRGPKGFTIPHPG